MELMTNSYPAKYYLHFESAHNGAKTLVPNFGGSVVYFTTTQRSAYEWYCEQFTIFIDYVLIGSQTGASVWAITLYMELRFWPDWVVLFHVV
jgi:hypothetical protein